MTQDTDAPEPQSEVADPSAVDPEPGTAADTAVEVLPAVADRKAAPTGRGRWNIRKLVCFSLDGRRRDIDLQLGAVNIITGNSHTGKSALAELLDYVMGASECNLPKRVFETCSWVGVLWQNGATQCLICRRVPEQRARGSEEFSYQVGAEIQLPEDPAELVVTIGRDATLKRFESLLGIGDVKTEVFGSETNKPVRVSFRNAMPYLLQDAGHIINPSHLLRGLDTQQRQHLLDTLPYFLGVVDESLVGRESELRRLRARIAAEERRRAERLAVAGSSTQFGRDLVREAVACGLLPEDTAALADDAPASVVLEALRTAHEARLALPDPIASDADLAGLRQREQDLVDQGSQLRTRAEAAKRAIEAVGTFTEGGELQQQRLDVVNLLPEDELRTCPLCVQPLNAHVERPAAVRRAVEQVRRELGQVARERPRLDATLVDLNDRRAAVSRQLSEVRASISAAVRSADDRRRIAGLDRQRIHVGGRISVYVENATVEVETLEAKDDLDSLRQLEQALADEVNTETKLEALAEARTRLGALATEIVEDLPIEEDYAGQTIDVNLRTLNVGVITPREREPMRSIGSDENILTLHVAVSLAFHRMFAERDRPVPSFLLFDQLSRPYYPPDPLAPAPERELATSQPEVASLKQYFEVLFREVARGYGLQVLVLEHAYFSDDERYIEATHERWIEGKALIPSNWPLRSVPEPGSA
jgi:hypothetical protein